MPHSPLSTHKLEQQQQKQANPVIEMKQNLFHARFIKTRQFGLLIEIQDCGETLLNFKFFKFTFNSFGWSMFTVAKSELTLNISTLNVTFIVLTLDKFGRAQRMAALTASFYVSFRFISFLGCWRKKLYVLCIFVLLKYVHW